MVEFDVNLERAKNIVFANDDLVIRFREAKANLPKEKFNILFDVDDDDAQDFMKAYNEIRLLIKNNMREIDLPELRRLTSEVVLILSQ